MDIQQNITDWLKSLKGWQTELAYRLLTKVNLDDSDIDDIISMLKQGSIYVEKEFPNVGTSINGQSITLLSIDSVSNIEQLSPRNPLKFAEHGITTVYGNNGTGKSGYTRILKKICGKTHSRDLCGNIYSDNQEIGKCSISYKVDNEEQSYEWEINAPAINALRAVDIFDTETGLAYLKEANTISYTPPIMDFFSAFSHYHDKIRELLQVEKDSLQQKLPVPPVELSTTIFVRQVYYAANIDLFKFLWKDEDGTDLTHLEQRLKEADPKKAANAIREKKGKIDALIKELNDAFQKVTQECHNEIMALSKSATDKEKAVIDAGKAMDDVSKLDGIGSESWILLWKAAQRFALEEAYKNDNQLFDNERCVLCHQILDQKAKDRLHRFDKFVSNQLSKEATVARQQYNDRIKVLPVIQTKDAIDNKCIASGIEDWGTQIFHVWMSIHNNGEAIRNGKPLTNIVQEVTTALSALQEKSKQYEEQAAKYDSDAESFDRETLIKQLLELKARKWCVEQIESIRQEQQRQLQIAQCDRWIALTNTRNVTSKTNEIGDIVITQGFVDRFNTELQNLGANNIKVEFNKLNRKGITQHVLRIANAVHSSPIDILSEGESRIIALAAFLADVTGGNNNNPFIFDDPISSLDQTYEEKTVKRLVELSKTRQVIVFTHRLSLLCQLTDSCNDMATLGVRREVWGTGEIGDTPISAKAPKGAINSLLNDKLARAKKILERDGTEAYYYYGKTICSEFRILIERVVETYLLADIVQRYRRAVNTMGKIGKLAKIKAEDCVLIDDYMTKYSYYEHSQPLEDPREIPMPNVIKKDIEDLLKWIDEFSKRQ